jgi:hypothetical protein
MTTHRPRPLGKTALALGLLALLILAWAPAAPAGSNQGGLSFSFLVLGDTRGDVFLPPGVTTAAALQPLLKARFGGRATELTFNPVTGEVERLVVKDKKPQDTTTYLYEAGWPRLIKKGEGDQARVIMRREGREWVSRRIVDAFRSGQGPLSPAFLVHTGDAILAGFQGRVLDHSPYWQAFRDELVNRLPRPDPGLGLPGRLFLAVGNHELWDDDDLAGTLTALPYLRRLGLTPANRVYSFDFKKVRFIFLDSGSGSEKGRWTGQHPDFQGQMAYLAGRLKEAKAQGIKRAFVVYHKPSFSLVGHGGLNPANDPQAVLKTFAQDLEIFVLAGHVHTTELFKVDGVTHVVLGGGGAAQILDREKSIPGHPQELYWQGQPRVEEYNYALVDVTPAGVKLRVHRYRPGQAMSPVEMVELLP